MANKKTVALTNEHYEEIINLMLVGASGFRPIGHQNFSFVTYFTKNIFIRLGF